MSSPASRTRQRQRRRAREKLWAVQRDLNAKKIDLAAYDHVIADMDKRLQHGDLPPFGGPQAASIVIGCREVTKGECDRLEGLVADLTKKAPP